MDGILYLAMGQEYDMLAAHTVGRTRENTSLPITVVSNLTLRHPKWDEVPNIHFIQVDVPQPFNRAVKTTMEQYTPYDRTLYIDTDAFVQHDRVGEIFDIMDDADMVLYPYRAWRTNNIIPKIMARALDTFGLDVPIQEYCSGCFGFRSSKKVHNFFKDWHKAWRQFGFGRDMPPFSCTLKRWHENGGLTSNCMGKEHFAAQWLDPDAVIQHDPNFGFPPEYNLPTWTPWHVHTDKPGEFTRIRRETR